MRTYEGEPEDLIAAFTNNLSSLSRERLEFAKAYLTFLSFKGDPEFKEKIVRYSSFHPSRSFVLQYSEDHMVFTCYDAFDNRISEIIRTRRTPEDLREYMLQHFTNAVTKKLIERIKNG